MGYSEAVKLFELPAGFTISDIKKSYHMLSRRFHPDLNNGKDVALCEEKMKDINNAYEILMSQTRPTENKKVKFTVEEQKIIHDLCQKLGMSNLDAFYCYSNAKTLGYSGSIIEWLQERLNHLSIYDDYRDIVLELAKNTNDFFNSEFEYIVRCYEDAGYKGTIVDWISELVRCKKLQEELGMSEHSLKSQYFEAKRQGFAGSFLEWLDKKAAIMHRCEQLGMEPFVAELAYWKEKSEHGFSGTMDDWLLKMVICKKLNCSADDILARLLHYYEENAKMDEFWNIANNNLDKEDKNERVYQKK